MRVVAIHAESLSHSVMSLDIAAAAGERSLREACGGMGRGENGSPGSEVTGSEEDVDSKERGGSRGSSLGEKEDTKTRSTQDNNAEAVAAARLTLKTVRENLDESQGIYLLYGSAAERSAPQRSASVRSSP
jgi:hypothetical protein